jgi:hypothetical protein
MFVWDDDRRPRGWTPHFYSIHFGIYLEVCSSEKIDYKYRQRIFTNNGYRVIFYIYTKNLIYRRINCSNIFGYLPMNVSTN